ncbi:MULTISPECIES: ATP-binding SpoIIE family protein phosphatase [unclassified Rhizobacter]|uniref:ATP-binding SpoIIE family protein phosphatase n=1 Tax=unclassified Rhizobacter TaxID=2640088 RepID=UPI000AF5C5EE|nr:MULTISPECIES: ATP-binding SpoIIE family protein phosphatase [unclassified Rhizobacter]
MAAHQVIPVTEPSQVGEARRHAARLASELGFGEVAAGAAAIVVTELATNLARHARGGRLLFATNDDGAIEVLSLDDGPGMADVAACLRDGFSTAGTPGNGLGAIQRLATRFSVFSLPGKGTVIGVQLAAGTAPPPAPAAYRIGAVSLAAPGETACGDAWRFRQNGERAELLVVDGLGHGPVAAEAADAAVAVFDDMPGATPSVILERAHRNLRTTRGAAVAIATLDDRTRQIVFSGAGNIAGRIISGVGDRTLLSQHGTVGFQVRQLQDISYDWPPHALLVLHSDGIVTRWSPTEAPGLLQCDPLVIAGWLVREYLRGRDDATVAVVQRIAA